MKIDIVNNGQEFEVPVLNQDISASLYIELLVIRADIEREFARFKVPLRLDPATGKPLPLNEQTDDRKLYFYLTTQKDNLLSLTAILRSIDPSVTKEMVDKKGAEWVNTTLQEIYRSARSLPKETQGGV